MSESSALKPDTNSDAWEDSLDIAQNLSSKENPIGGCLWFIANSTYKKQSKTEGGKEYYKFGNGDLFEVTEKVVIGGHTFFRITGY